MVLRTITRDGLGVLQNIPSQRRRPTMNRTHASIVTWHVAALVYYLYTALVVVPPTAASRLVDLSHTFDESTIYWVTAKRLDFTVTHNGTADGKDYWYQSDEIAAATHGGTHMDSPCHFALGRWCISDIPLERLVIQAAIVDISKDVGDDPGVHLSVRHLTEWEEAHGRIPDNSLLLVRSGWSRFWPDPLTYSGTTERNASLLRFPSVTPEAAKWLVENRRIVGIGVDTMSIDTPGGRPATHITLMEQNIYGLENVNLAQPLPPTGARVHVMPMKLKGASGAPCRIVAELPEGGAGGTSGNVMSLSDSLTLVRTMALVAAVWAYFGRRFY